MSSDKPVSDGWREFIAELKSKADIVAYIGEVVPLRRAGRSFKGLCPFHGEKTPSFHVDPGRQMFHCFGCGKGGDLLSFVQEHEHLPFVEAAKRIAGRFGVPVPEWKPATAEERAREARRKELGDALAAAQELFEARLYAQDPEGRQARRYLKGRGLDSTIAKVFGIGYAPKDPGALEAALQAKGISPPAMKEAGLLHLGRGGDARGAFRGRVTFPIRSASGKLLGFGARTLGADEPKYINSPDSMFYRKGNNLYGLFEAVKTLRGGTPAILVEGNLDVVSLHKAGFTGTVAPLGTALTEDQARLLEGYTEKVVLMMDGDAAGHRAALRSLPILLARRLEVTVAVLPEGADPDDLVRKEGAEALQRAVDAAVNPIAFALDELSRGLDLREPRFRARVVDQLRPFVKATANPVERQTYVQIVADRLSVDERTVLEAMDRPASRRDPPGHAQSRAPAAAPPAPEVEAAAALTTAERMLLAGILRDPTLLEPLEALSPLVARAGGEAAIWSAQGLGLLGELRKAAADVGSPAAVGLDRVSDPAMRRVFEAFLEDPGLQGLDAEQATRYLMELVLMGLHRVRKEKRMAAQAAQGDQAEELRLGQEAIEIGKTIDKLQEGILRMSGPGRRPGAAS